MAYSYRRLTVICGHYGSGKTNLAVNMAFDLKKQYENTAVADLDIVNPYFRTKDSEAEFQEAGIRLICSRYASGNLDIPALPDDLYAITDDKSLKVILDIGGDDRGAYVLGRLSPKIVEEQNYEMLLVINAYRPLTRTAEEVLEVVYEIQTACRIPFTGIVNDSNLGAETTAEDVMDTFDYAKKVSELTGLPVVMTAVDQDLYPELIRKVEEKKDAIDLSAVGEIFPMKLQKRPV